MDHAIDTRPFPKGPLYGAFALVALTFVGVGYARLSTPPAPVPSDAVAERQLRFVDRGDGSIDVMDAGAGRVIGRIEPGHDGFLRATMRGLAQERIRRGIGPDLPFTLSLHPDGRVTLDDPAIGRHVDLAAFGHTNEAAFARFLDLNASKNAPGAPQEAP
jgi:putative photosynthetic complex assembly protein